MIMDQKEFEQMLRDRGLVLCCIHVQQQTRNAEYHKEDQAFVCTKCRDRLRDKGFDKIKNSLAMVDKSCLGI